MNFLRASFYSAVLLLPVAALADNNNHPITCGRPTNYVRVNPLVGMSKLRIRFSSATLHTHIEKENTWREDEIGEAEVTITLHRKFSDQLDALQDSLSTAKKHKLRFCIQDENADERSALGKRYASGPTEDEAIAETISR